MKKENGFSLIEVLISMLLLAIVGTAFLNALVGSTNAMITADKQATAKNVAETQMEYIKKQQYSISYTPASLPEEYNGYSAVVTAQSMRDTNIQKITVLIKYRDIDVFTLEDYKVKR